MTGTNHDGARMAMDRFAAILDAYGAAPQRWPADERAAAESLLAASAQARALQAGAARLDDVLAGSRAPAPSAALRRAILQAAPGAASRPVPAAGTLRGLWQSLAATFAGELGGLRPAAAMLGIALILGAMAGGAVEVRTMTLATAEQDVDLVQLALFDDSYGEF